MPVRIARPLALVAITVAFWLLWCPSAQAGLYHRPVAEEILQPVPTWSRFFDTVIPQLRSFAPPDPLSGTPASRLRQAACQRIETLAQKPEAELTADDYVDWSGLLVRLITKDGQSTLELAQRVLERGRARFPRDDYRLTANLATVYQLSGEYDRALALLQETIALAPEPAQRWERWHLRLAMQRRAQQHLRQLGKLPRDEAVLDDLFGVRWWETPPSDNPPPHPLATSPTSPETLPTEAGEVLQQLLIWFPFDGQLWWLLAEWLAARQEWSAAAQAMQMASDLRLAGQQFRQRRAWILQTAQQHRSTAPALALPDLPLPAEDAPTDRPIAWWSRFDWRAWTLLIVGGLLLLYLAGWQIRLWLSRLFRRFG
jgi:tetratricopeptide (TPR) repeat protein